MRSGCSGHGLLDMDMPAICHLRSHQVFAMASYHRGSRSIGFLSPRGGSSELPRLPCLPFVVVVVVVLLLLLLANFPSPSLAEASRTAEDLVSDPCETLPPKKTVIDYGALHACVFGQRLAFSVPALLAMVVLAFYILAQTAQHHFSPVVAKMAELLHLSPSTGGVTLLALGNGAPDVFGSIAAVWGGNPRIGLGAIVSAGLFVTAFVVGFVALAASPFPLNPTNFIRDVCFYILAVTLMFLLYMSGEVHAWQAVGLVLLYVLFVAVVFSMDQAGRKDRGLKATVSNLDPARIDIPGADVFEDPTQFLHVNDGSRGGISQRADNNENSLIVLDHQRQGLDAEAGNLKSKTVKSPGQSLDVDGGTFSPKQPKDFSAVFSMLFCSLLCCRSKKAGKCSTSFKLHLIWQVPLEVVLRSTIPAVDPSKWNRIYASLNLVCCPLIMLYIVSEAVSPYRHMVFIIPGINFSLWSLILLQGSILGAAYYVFTKEPPKNELPIAIITAFVMSVFWISFIAGELLGCLATLGKLLKLPPALLGLTVLAWGNSIGDLVADVAVARGGQPAMAMAGCFAGPMFNMLVGFGLALAMKASRMHPAPYLLDYNPSIVIAFGFLFVSLLGSLLVITWCKFRVPRFWGFVLIALYIMFVIVSISNANVL